MLVGQIKYRGFFIFKNNGASSWSVYPSDVPKGAQLFVGTLDDCVIFIDQEVQRAAV